MSITVRLKSKDLNQLNESLQKISLFEDQPLASSPIQKDDTDDTFYSDIKTNNPQNVAQNMNDTDEVNVIEPNDSDDVQKQKITADIANIVADLIDKSDNLKDLFNQASDLSADQDAASQAWVLNNDKNDLFLQVKNAHIFRQNKNICLSHDDRVETFRNEGELSQYLNQNNYPALPEGIMKSLVESSIDQIKTLLTEAPREINDVIKLLVSDKQQDRVSGKAAFARADSATQNTIINELRRLGYETQAKDAIQYQQNVDFDKFLQSSDKVAVWELPDYIQNSLKDWAKDIKTDPNKQVVLQKLLYYSIGKATPQDSHYKDIRGLLTLGQGYNLQTSNITMEHRTPLMLAASKGLVQTVNDLISMHAQIDEQDVSGNTALTLATLLAPANTKYLVAEALLKAGANMNIKNDEGQSFATLANKVFVTTNGNSISSKLKQLYQTYSNTNTQNVAKDKAVSQLFNAITQQDVDSLPTLVDELNVNLNKIQVSPEQATKFGLEAGDTLLNVAIRSGNLNVVKYLLSKGLSPWATGANGKNAEVAAAETANNSVEGEQIAAYINDYVTKSYDFGAAQKVDQNDNKAKKSGDSSIAKGRLQATQALAKSASPEDKQAAQNIADLTNDTALKQVLGVAEGSQRLSSYINSLKEEFEADFNLDPIYQEPTENTEQEPEENTELKDDVCVGSAGLATVAALTPGSVKKKKAK